MKRSLVLVLAVTAARLLIAAFHPVTEDEAYYWTWSLHPAFGYIDHPPMVAWVIASTTWLRNVSPLAIRAGFVFCEGIAALAAGAAALEISRSERSALVTTVLVAFVPNVKLMIGEALPDPPFLMFWALALWCAARLPRTYAWLDVAGLGAALGGAILTRVFGWALLAGVLVALMAQPQRRLRLYALPAVCIALAVAAPWIAWNAGHDWANVLFSVRDRQTFRTVSATHAFNNMTVRFLLYDGAFIALAYLCTIRRRLPLLAWTALPLPLALAVLAFPQTVEAYWLLGPAISLFVALGVAASARARWADVAVGAWAVAGTCSLFVVAFAALPESVQASLLRYPAVAGGAYSPAYAYRNVARDVAHEAAKDDAAILSDRYEITSQLQLFGVSSAIVDDVPQRKQWRLWNPTAAIPARAVYVSSDPLGANPALLARIRSVYVRVAPQGAIDYRFAGKPAFRMYFTSLDRPRPNALPAQLFGS